MENKNNEEKKPRTELFINSLGQEVTMTYNPALDNLPTQETPEKYTEAYRRRHNLKPPIDLRKLVYPEAD